MLKTSFYIVIAAWVAAIGALVTDFLGFTDNIALFGRAGAVLTLCAAALEYNISTKGQKDTDYEEGGPVGLIEVGSATLLTKQKKWWRSFAHITIILGTLIWGFGDLPFHS
ncbi:hypothetical protein [Marinimicrobium sp. ARAG 43.8]|uniref:hypothetical protein n=1 Tax=Marinimicrobium sp. ARAG 43.8 TaxID=3418719 RepID=UPI003CF55DCF